MKIFVHKYANNQNLRLSSFWMLGGFFIISLFGYLASDKSENKIPLDSGNNFNVFEAHTEDNEANFLLATSIGDYAWIDCDKDGIQDTDESPLAFVPVELFGMLDNGQTVELNTSTNANGWYIFENLKPGKYKLTFGFPAEPTGLDYAPQNQTSDDEDSDVDPDDGMTINYTIDTGDVLVDIDAGFIDATKPLIEGIPDDETVECDAIPEVPVIGVDITATDNLDDDVALSFTESIVDGDCIDNYFIERVWTAVDDCGNIREVSQTITVEDNTEPEIIGSPLDLTIDTNVGEVVPDPAQVTATDNCDTNVTVEFDEMALVNGCETLITRTWTAYDNCGQSHVHTQEINVIGSLSPTVESNGPVCQGETLELSATGGDTYEWSGPNGFSSFDPNPEIDNVMLVNSGTYTVIIGAGNCEATEEIDVVIQSNCNCGAEAGATAPVEMTICYEGGNAMISGLADGNTVIPTGFSLLYILSEGGVQEIEAVSATPEFTVSGTGIFTIHAFVFDPTAFDISSIQFGTTRIEDIYETLEQGGGNICGAIEFPGMPITIVQPLAEVQSTSSAQCGFCTGTATLSPIAFGYAWSDGGEGASRQDLCAGIYEVIATDPATGCTDELTIAIEEDCACSPPVIANLVVIESSCGAMNASASIELTGNNADYDYEWFPNIGTPSTDGSSRTDLPAGTYTVSISTSADSSCFLEETFVIGNSDGPEIELFNSSPATCNEANATALIAPPFYNYDWSDGGNGSSRVGLIAGSYQITVTDPSNGCFNVIDVNIENFNPLSAAVQVGNFPDCNTTNGAVTINIGGGSGNYVVDWSDGGNGENRNDLAAGIYSFTVTDNGGSSCVIEEVFVLENEVDGNAGIVIANEPIMVSCVGAADGMVDYAVNFSADFVTPETVSIQNAAGGTVANGSLSGGDYCIIIMDGNGCIAGQSCFEVLEPSQFDIDVMLTNVDCDDLGVISVAVSGGNGVYDFDWEDLIGTADPPERMNLSPGTYNLTVSDINGCSAVVDNLIILDDCTTSPCPSSETVYVALDVEEIATQCIEMEDCFDINQTTINLLDGSLTGNSLYGSWNLDASGCLTYESGMIEGDFIDTVYVIAEYNGLEDTTCFVFSISTMSLSNPDVDTIYISVNEEIPYMDCIPLDELDGNFASIDILYPPLNGTGIFTVGPNSACFTYTSNPGQSGNFIDTMAVIICDDLSICDTTIIVVSVISSGCPDIIIDETASITVFECFEFGFYCLPIAPPNLFNYQITDNGEPYFQGFVPCDFDTLFLYPTDVIIAQVPTGPYELINWTENGEGHSIAEFADLEELVDSMNAWDPAGNWMLRADNKIEGGTDPALYGLLNIDQITAPFNSYSLNLSILPFPNGSQIGVDTGYHEIIVNNIFTGCQDTLILEVECTNVFCPEIYTGPLNIMAEDCDSLTEVCLDIDLEDLINYTISDNGVFYSGGFNGCNLDTLLTYLTIGYNAPNSYTLDNWMVNGQMFMIDNFMTLDVLVDSMNVWDPNGNWSIQGLFIIGGDFSNDYGNIVISQGGNIIATSNPNLELMPNGISIEIDTGFHELIVIDTTTGCEKVVEITVGCIPFTGISTDTLLTVFEGMADTFCLDVSGVNTVSSIINVCPDESDGNVGLTILPGINCVEYTGDLLGIDTFCIEVCDNVLGICDTTNLIIQVLPLTDTIDISLLLGFSDTICLDTTIFQNPISFVNNFNAFDDVEFFLNDDEYCAEITGIDVGMDTLCLLTCDDMGFCDTTYIFIDVIPQTIDTIITDIIVGTTDTICIDTMELAGTIVSINNYCLGSSGTFVDFDILDEFCVSFEGLVPNGTDTACIEICDEFGYCDTTIFIVTSIPNGTIDPPIAVDDNTTTVTGNPIIINVLENDTLNSTLIDIGIVDEPANGSVIVNTDFSITYIPDAGFCGELDSFTYFITTIGGTDTATVLIDILCDEITIYNGFSPNGDGVNDVFNITGIETFPDNKVYIFNRWGNQVFYRKGYSNSDPFDGTWEGKTLPDGTYFYLVEVEGEEGKTLKFNGYLQIHR